MATNSEVCDMSKVYLKLVEGFGCTGCYFYTTVKNYKLCHEKYGYVNHKFLCQNKIYIEVKPCDTNQ